MQRAGFVRAAAVTKSDTVDLGPGFTCKAVYCGGATSQDIKILTVGGSTIVFTAVPPGTILPVQAKRIYSAGTGFANADMLALGD